MAAQKLTDGLVEGLKAGDRDLYVWDAALPRFGIRVTRAGAKIYLVQYRTRAGGQEKAPNRRITIGRHDGQVWNVTKARARARKLLASVDLGQDPFADRESEREAARLAAAEAQAKRHAAEIEAKRQQTETFRALGEVYIARKLKSRRSSVEAARLLRHGPMEAWGDLHISAIRRADVVELLEAIGERSAAVARATYAELRPFFDWCLERDLISASPCASVTAPARPKARDRVLSKEELRLVWIACGRLDYPFGPAIKLLILTGQRRAEVSGMRWEELNLEGGHWRIPAERAKNGQAHEIDLCPEALRILREVRELGLDASFVFPARGGGQGLKGWSATKRRLDQLIEEVRAEEAALAGAEPPASPLADWRLHDLRRTAATGMAALGFAPHIVERVLNHVSGTQAGLVGVYQRHEYREERKAAVMAWASELGAIVTGRPTPSNVIPMRAS